MLWEVEILWEGESEREQQGRANKALRELSGEAGAFALLPWQRLINFLVQADCLVHGPFAFMSQRKHPSAVVRPSSIVWTGV